MSLISQTFRVEGQQPSEGAPWVVHVAVSDPLVATTELASRRSNHPTWAWRIVGLREEELVRFKGES